MEALRAIVGAAQHVLERRLDEAAQGQIPAAQLLAAALVLEGVRVWLRIHGGSEPERIDEPIKLRGETEIAPVATCTHYGDDEFGPN